MVKDSSNDKSGVASRTRQKSSSSHERRNSVSDIKHYFNHMANANGKKPLNRKEKDKDKFNKSQSNEELMPAISKDNTNTSKSLVNSDKKDRTNTMAADNHDNNEPAQPQSEKINEKTDNNEEHPITKVSASTQTTEDAILASLNALTTRVVKMEEEIYHPKNSLSYQLAKTNEKVQGVYQDIHGAVDGVKVKLEQVSANIQSSMEKISSLEASQNVMATLLDENKRLIAELQVIQGLVQKISQQSSQTSSQVLDLTKRGMEQNLILFGIDNELEIQDAKAKEPMFKPKERCKHSVLRFLKEVMNVDLEIEDIWKAHRVGAFKKDKMRPVVIKASYAAKELILENIATLKGKKNCATDQTYFISEQLPEGVAETKKQVSARLKKLNENNEGKSPANRDKIHVQGDKILVNGELDMPEVTTPQPSQLFVDTNEQNKINLLQARMCETDISVEKHSEFKAIALKVHSIEEVQRAYVGVCQRYPASDHIILGYALKENGNLKYGFADDREYGAGSRVKNCIFESKLRNTAVFVLRKYGGIHLGFDRFRAIENSAKSALQILQESL